MSSDVQAKWMNSAARATSGMLGEALLQPVLDRLDVVVGLRSIAFTRAASAGAKRAPTASSAARAASENGGSSAMPSSSDSATSQSISTRTRWRMRPYSEKCPGARRPCG